MIVHNLQPSLHIVVSRKEYVGIVGVVELGMEVNKIFEAEVGNSGMISKCCDSRLMSESGDE